MSNLRTFLTNICYDFFSNWQTEKKLFCTNKLRKIRGQNLGNKLVKTSEEFVINNFRVRDFFKFCGLLTISELHRSNLNLTHFFCERSKLFLISVPA